MTVEEALRSCSQTLEEKYPGEFLDPDALGVILVELRRLQAMEQRARDVAENGLSLDGTEGEMHAARYILDPW